MSDWDVIGSVVGAAVGTVLAGPVGGIAGFVGGGLLGGDDAPQHLPWGEKPPPYPGSPMHQLWPGEVNAQVERCKGSLDPANAATGGTTKVSTRADTAPRSCNGEYPSCA